MDWDKSEIELSRLIHLEKIKTTNHKFLITASDEECRDLSERFDLIELRELQSEFIVNKSQTNVFASVVGNFSAIVVQTCVVTLDLVVNEIGGSFKCNFEEQVRDNTVKTIDFNAFDTDHSEPIINGKINVGAIIIEEFGLGIDPFPRIRGSQFESIGKNYNEKLEKDDSNNPFEVLRNLK